jgi:putative transposase
MRVLLGAKRLKSTTAHGNICDVKLVAPIKLLPTPEHKASLLKTLRAANTACNEISTYAREHGVFKRFDIHRAVYKNTRESSGLAAQVVVQCIAKVAACYKRDKKRHHGFRLHAAQPFDDRIFRMCTDDVVSIWTVDGRIKVPFVCGEHQRQLLANRKGEVDLQMQGGDFYIVATCDVSEATPIAATDVLGVDLGIINIAVDSDGQPFSGEDVERCRRRNAHRRRNLQRKGTRAARRKLCEISGRQARFQKDVNHCISKQLVQKAKRTERAIALEDLSGIRSRVTARRRQRARLHNWGFFQLGAFVGYKACRDGVPVLYVDPAYTSQTCPVCGHISRRNRPDRGTFRCEVCGHAGPADHIAALNIRARAIVNWPNGGQLLLQGSVPTPAGGRPATSPSL